MSEQVIDVKAQSQYLAQKKEFEDKLIAEAKKRKKPACLSCVSYDFRNGSLKPMDEYFNTKSKGVKTHPANKKDKNQNATMYSLRGECNNGHDAILFLTEEEYGVKTK